MTDFALPMISRTYDPAAKCFVSLGEMNPFVFVGFPSRRDPKGKAREMNGGFVARATRRGR